MLEVRTLDQLTEDDLKKILAEYYAPAKDRTKMTNEEIKELAIKLNKKINVPLINETREEKILIKVVKKIDNFLYDNLPNEFYDLIRSAEDGIGIDDNEAKRLIKRLSKLANDKIDIPYIPEPAEYVAFRFVIGIIINAARKKWNLTMAEEAFEKENIPNAKEVEDSELEALVA